MTTACPSRHPHHPVAALLLAGGLLLGAGAATAAGPTGDGDERPSDLVLITLDTTRADHLGCYGAEGADTPTLDALAARGTRWASAITPSPLTLPSHASLLTGLAPPEHGARDNGTSTLAAGLPTLATILAGRGWATAAFVASRVLDRRFGLGRGFTTYDDRMTAEATGEYGYPERDAEAVTSAALAWAEEAPRDRPWFLWVHYYDPHAPYEPPARWRQGDPEADYAGEIAFVDEQVGRLLAGLPGEPGERLVAVVGDHGEALGEHGERTHGLFLYRASLEVPLIVAGLGVPAGRVVDEVVASRRLAPTLLALLGAAEPAAAMPPPLPGLPSLDAGEPRPVFSETRMPARAYGWSPLTALTDGDWRLVVAPRPELYHWRADPDESHDLSSEEPERAARLRRTLAELQSGYDEPADAPVEVDPELAAELRALGYVADSGAAHGEIDPKDGIVMLDELAEAKRLLAAGDTGRAREILRGLVRRSPGSVPFLTHLARAELAGGDPEAALAAYREAVELNPRLDFLHLNLGEAYLRLGRFDEAEAALREALEINPRAARGWLGLAEMAARAGRPAEERRLLLEAVAAGTASAGIRSRLGQIEIAAGDLAAAAAHLEEAAELAPGWPLPWLLWGQVAEARQRAPEALERYRRAASLAPDDPSVLLRLGRLELAAGDPAAGRRHLERAAALAPASPVGQEARRLLSEGF